MKKFLIISLTINVFLIGVIAFGVTSINNRITLLENKTDTFDDEIGTLFDENYKIANKINLYK